MFPSYQTCCRSFRPKDLLPSRDVGCLPALSLALIAVALGSSGLRYQCELTTLVTNPASTQAPDGTKGPKPSWKSLLMVLLNLPDDTQRISLTVVKGANPMASKRSRPTERTESKAFFLGSLVPAQPHLGPERLAAMDDPAVRHTNMTTHPDQACDMEDSRKSQYIYIYIYICNPYVYPLNLREIPSMVSPLFPGRPSQVALIPRIPRRC